MNHGLVSWSLAICIAWMPQSALAVILSCTIDSAGLGIIFNNYVPYEPTSTSSDTAGTFTVSCLGTLGGTAHIWLSTGLSGNFTWREMARSGGGDPLQYNLYIDSSHSTVWADGSGAHPTISCAVACPLSPTEYTVYGHVKENQPSIVPGSFSDTITITVNF